MYIEITYQPGKKTQPEEAYERSMTDLRRAAFFTRGSDTDAARSRHRVRPMSFSMSTGRHISKI